MKRPIQTIVYLPYFLSWVILAKIVLNIFGYTGPVNQIIGLLEAMWSTFWRSKAFPASGDRYGYLKGFGYNTVVYLAAIPGVDGSLYEAAAVDGCGRFKRIWHVTYWVSNNSSTLAILSLGNILNADSTRFITCITRWFTQQEISLTHGYTEPVCKIYSLATAAGLFKSVISLVLITVGYWLADKFTGYKLF